MVSADQADRPARALAESEIAGRRREDEDQVPPARARRLPLPLGRRLDRLRRAIHAGARPGLAVEWSMMAAVDRSSPMPVYFQIALDVRRRIAAGEWQAGERIAPELQLVREYAVSRVTIRQALAELVKDDLLERHRGSGTYVREQQHPLVYDLNLTVGGNGRPLARGGPGRTAADVIECGVLDLPPHELRLRLQIPGRRARRLSRAADSHQRGARRGLPLVVRRRAGARPRARRRAGRLALGRPRASSTGSSPPAPRTRSRSCASRARTPNCSSSAHDVPLLVVTSTTYLPDGAPLEYAQMMWLGDRVRFHFTSHPTPDGGSSAPTRARRARNRPSRSTRPGSG